MKSFAIPQNNKEIKELAGQPLLLLMLALYDSAGNQLGQAKKLNQTLLYDSLLRQFIERELRKDTNKVRALPNKEETSPGFRAKTLLAHLDLDDQTCYTWRESDAENICAHQ